MLKGFEVATKTVLFLTAAKTGIKRFATQLSNWKWTTLEARDQTGRQKPLTDLTSKDKTGAEGGADLY